MTFVTFFTVVATTACCAIFTLKTPIAYITINAFITVITFFTIFAIIAIQYFNKKYIILYSIITTYTSCRIKINRQKI